MNSIISDEAAASEVRAFIARSIEGAASNLDTEEAFNRLAAAVFALQAARVPVYREFCQRRGVVAVADWREIPALPVAAFRAYEITSLEPEHRRHVFHSSGTTRQHPSRHFHSDASRAIYEESLRPWFRRHFLTGPTETMRIATLPPLEGTSPSPRIWGLADDGAGHQVEVRQGARLAPPEGTSPSPWPSPRWAGRGNWQTPQGQCRDAPPETRMPLIVLTPSAAQAPHSSLAHMFDTVRSEFSAAVFTGSVGAEGAWELDLAATMAALADEEASGHPVALLGTAFSFVLLLERCQMEKRRFRLAAGSRALETGGYKGRGREVRKAELRQLMTRWLGIPASHIVGEYGMCELSSQAYDRAVGEAEKPFQFPPWARAQIISPETGREVAEGETGMIRVFDLANVWSVLAVQTEDLGVRRRDGFELAGRALGAAARGCSLLPR